MYIVRISFCAALCLSGLTVAAASDKDALVNRIKEFAFSVDDCRSNVERLKELARSINDMNLLNIADDTGATLLHRAAEACDTVSIELLSSWGANINMRDTSGDTPLHLTVSKGYAPHIPVVQKLLACGADPDITNYFGTTLMEDASRSSEEGFFYLIMTAMQRTLEQFCSQVPTLQKQCIYTILAHKIDIRSMPSELQQDISATQQWLNTKLQVHVLDMVPNNFLRIALLLRRGASPNGHNDVRVTGPLKQSIALYFHVNGAQSSEVLKVIHELVIAGARPGELRGLKRTSCLHELAALDYRGSRAIDYVGNRTRYEALVSLLCTYAQETDFLRKNGEGKTVIKLLKENRSDTAGKIYISIWREAGAPV